MITAQIIRTATSPLAIYRFGWVAVLLLCSPVSFAQKSKPAITPVVQTEFRTARNERLPVGVPFGGIGCGGFQLMTDGAVSRATYNNNLTNPLGDLAGCFASIWTETDGKSSARTLKLKSEYGLPVIGGLEYEFRYPEALIKYSDSTLPVAVSLKAITPIIPHDLKNSNLPVALFLFSVHNSSKSAVTVSIALSWENLNGVGESNLTGPFSDRTGATVESLPAREGIFGMKMTGPIAPKPDPPNRLYYNARGNYALMAIANEPEFIYSACSWNALAKQPEWWTEFSKSGALSGKAALGKESSVHPAAAISLKLTLKPGETRDFPFAFCWYTPRQYTIGGAEYGHLYQKNFDDAWDVGRYALADRESLTALTEEWMNKITRSSLPSWFQSMIFKSAEMISRDTILTRDSGGAMPDVGHTLVGVVESRETGKSNSIGNQWNRLLGNSPLTTFFPSTEPLDLHSIFDHQTVTGRVPSHSGDWEHSVGTLPDDWIKEPDTAEATIAYAIRAARFFKHTGDQVFLDRFYPSVKHAVERLIGTPKDSPIWGDNHTLRGSWPAALVAANRLATDMADKSFAAICKKALEQFNSDEIAAVSLENGGLIHWTAQILKCQDMVKSLPQSVAIDPFSVLNTAWNGDYDLALSLCKRLYQPLPTSLMQTWSESALWSMLDAFSGFDYDVPQACLTLTPHASDKVRAWRAPIFAPKFWGSVEYQPGDNIHKVIFRLDRLMPTSSIALEKRPSSPVSQSNQKPAVVSGAMVVIKSVQLNSHGSKTKVTASLGRAPLLGKVSAINGAVVTFTFDTPLELVSGQRIEFVVQ